MMDMRKILKEHNLGIERFVSLIGTSLRSLHKYENDDKSLKQSTRDKIENGLMLLDESGIIWPGDPVGGHFDFFRMNEWRLKTWDCSNKFQEFIKTNANNT